MITGNQGLVKQLNKWLVLNTVRQADAVSRADVARLTGLNSATVSKLTAELLDEGLIQEQGQGSSRGGRRPIMLRVNPSGLFAVGLEIQPSTIRGLVVNLEAGIISRLEHPLAPGLSLDGALDTIVACVREVLAQSGIPPEKTVGVGVAVPGLIDGQTGVILQSVPLNWRNVPLGEALKERLGLKVILERDCQAAALGELWYGAGRHCRDMVFLLVDMGIGAGVVVDRRLYRGAHGGVGQIGHIAVDVHGPRCNCGNYGCLEAFASGSALVRRVGTVSRLAGAPGGRAEQGPDLYAVLQAARAGDNFTGHLLEEAGYYLGLALGNIINIYDPEVVIVGGLIPISNPALFEAMKSAAGLRALQSLAGQVEITRPHFGLEACAVGAATLVLEQLFEPVQVVAVGHHNR